MKNYFFIFVSVWMLFSFSQCENSSSDIPTQDKSKKESFLQLPEVKYAKGFKFEKDSIGNKLVITNPNISNAVIATYYLLDKNQPKPEGISPSNVLRLPIKTIACLSAPEVEAVSLLGELPAIVGISNVNYVSNPFVKKQVVSGAIQELSKSGIVNFEKVVETMPDVVMMSWFDGTNTSDLSKVGVTVIPNVDYMEQHPLGRAEWIKLYGILFDKNQLAQELFLNCEVSYNELKAKVENLNDYPTMISGKMLSGIWYVPGGQSYLANILSDAKVNYLWKGTTQSGSIPLDIEKVISVGQNADFWLLAGHNADSTLYKSLASENELYTEFSAYSHKKLLFCDTSDGIFFEKSPFEPHVILADIVFGVHPNVLPNYVPKYYKIIN